MKFIPQHCNKQEAIVTKKQADMFQKVENRNHQKITRMGNIETHGYDPRFLSHHAWHPVGMYLLSIFLWLVAYTLRYKNSCEMRGFACDVAVWYSKH